MKSIMVVLAVAFVACGGPASTSTTPSAQCEAVASALCAHLISECGVTYPFAPCETMEAHACAAQFPNGLTPECVTALSAVSCADVESSTTPVACQE
jgi:hypothetical protein